MKGKSYNQITVKSKLKNNPVINQLPIANIVFGTMLAAALVHRVEPADYTGCG